jgi:hypothetical protein
MGMPLPPAANLVLSDAQRKRLVTISRHRSAPLGIVLRTSIVLGAAEGLANRVLARKLCTSVPTTTTHNLIPFSGLPLPARFSERSGNIEEF